MIFGEVEVINEIYNMNGSNHCYEPGMGPEKWKLNSVLGE